MFTPYIECLYGWIYLIVSKDYKSNGIFIRMNLMPNLLWLRFKRGLSIQMWITKRITNAQWSSSLGREWQNCSKKSRRLFNGYVPNMTKIWKDMYAYMCTFPDFAQRPTLLPNFWAFLDFWSWFEGVIHAIKMFKNIFLLKIYPNLPKKSNLLQSVRMIMGVLSPPLTTV